MLRQSRYGSFVGIVVKLVNLNGVWGSLQYAELCSKEKECYTIFRSVR